MVLGIRRAREQQSWVGVRHLGRHQQHPLHGVHAYAHRCVYSQALYLLFSFAFEDGENSLGLGHAQVPRTSGRGEG